MNKLICGHCSNHALKDGKRICKLTEKKIFYVGTCEKFAHTPDPAKFVIENKPSYLHRIVNFLTRLFKKYFYLNPKMK